MIHLIKFHLILIVLIVWISHELPHVNAQKLQAAKQNRKKLIMNEFFGDEHEDEEESSDSDYFEPWTFPETSPTFSFRDENEEHELVWTVSAGQLIKMLNPKIYNKLQAPGQIYGHSTNVEVAMYIESMSTFRAQSMDFEVDMYLMLSWQDHRLRHNSSHPILLTDLPVSKRMWQPDLYFVNSKFSYMHRVTTPNFMVVVYQDGYVMKTMRIDVTLACMLDLHHFPMDEQSCAAIIQSYAFVENVVKLSWHTSNKYPIHFNPGIKINDMDRVDPTINETCNGDYPLFRGKGTWSCLRGVIKMRRKLQFHVFQIFIPSGMLVLISWLSFWLDIRASPARISLTITTLLTLTTMSNGSRQELPHVPYMKANDVWFTVCQGFVFSVLLEYTLVNFFLGRHPKSKKTATMESSTSEASKMGIFPLIPLQESDAAPTKTQYIKDNEVYAKLVDTVAKILFPTSFVIFIVVYWSVFCSTI